MTDTTTKPARQKPLNIVQRSSIVDTIRQAPDDKPDTELAADISKSIGRAVSVSTVRAYRTQLGLKLVAAPSRAELLRRLADAEAALAKRTQPDLDLTKSPDENKLPPWQVHSSLLAETGQPAGVVV